MFEFERFKKILPEDITGAAERFARTRSSFFSPDAQAYRALVSSKEYKDLLGGWTSITTEVACLKSKEEGEGPCHEYSSSSFEAYSKMARGDRSSVEKYSEIRYNTDMAKKLAQIHSTYCADQPETGSLCKDIGSMLNTFGTFRLDDERRDAQAAMNNGDWGCPREPSRYDVTPVDERPRWIPG